jgi:hypothetical protein
MSEAVKEALERAYESLHQNNAGLDKAIEALKAALHASGMATVSMEKERLPQNNRQGRKMLQTYFKKRGVVVTFAEAEEQGAA